MPRALISVYDKTGLVEFAKDLHQLGYTIISTGGTANALTTADIPVIPIELFTSFPEGMGGRLKTLHPKVHGGLLGRLDKPDDRLFMDQQEIPEISMVACNLYPFEQKVREELPPEELNEFIDIGGPTMLRSGAKNAARVTVLTDPDDYAEALKQIREEGDTYESFREYLAAKVFMLTALYDAAIAMQKMREHGNMYDDIAIFRGGMRAIVG